MKSPPLCSRCRSVEVSKGSRTGICRNCYYELRKIYGKAVLTKEEISQGILNDDTDPVLKALLSNVPPSRFWSEPPDVVKGPVAVISDLHVPKHDSLLISRMCAVARRDKISQLIIGGDLIDFEEISRHRKTGDRQYSAVESLTLTMRLLHVLSSTFDRIWVIKGNHDDRLQRLIETVSEKRTALEVLLDSLSPNDSTSSLPFRDRFCRMLEFWRKKVVPDMKARVKWLPVPEILVEGPPNELPYRLVHPMIYSRNAPQAERRLWRRYVQPILGTHGHIWGMSISDNGRHPIIQIGCGTTADRHYYLSERITDHPVWVRGFATIIDGVIRTYVDNPYLTNWRKEVGF